MFSLQKAIVFSTIFVMLAVPRLALADGNVVVIVLDDSGSMNDRMKSDGKREPRMVVAKRALQKLVEQLPEEETQLGVLLLNGSKKTGGWLVPLGRLYREDTLKKIQIVLPNGGTPLGRSLKTAMDALLEHRRKQPAGDYRLLVVTDGEATDKKLLQTYLPDIVARGIFVDVIGVDMQSDHTLAQRSHSYRRADDAASLERALTEVFAESTYSDDFNAAQADFDMLAAIPDELAEKALVGLADLQQHPIGAKSNRKSSQNEAESPNVITDSGPPASKATDTTSWVCLIAFFILVLVTIRIVVTVITKIMK